MILMITHDYCRFSKSRVVVRAGHISNKFFQIVILKDLDRRQVICKHMESIQRVGKNYPINGNFNNDNKTYPSHKNDNSRLQKDGNVR